MSSKLPIIAHFLKGRFSILLLTMVLMFFLAPLTSSNQSTVDEVFAWVGLVVLISCLRAISTSRKFFYFMTALALLNAIIGSAEIYIEDDHFQFVGAVLLFKLLYFLLIFFSIMRYVLDSSPVTTDKICGALSAYMLMGFIWSIGFTIFYHFNPASFNVPERLLSGETVNSLWTVYFSFTTLTTLGYGDITPQTTAAQSYAIMEAAIGQIFVAVIIARLVALQIIHVSQNRPSGTENGQL